MTRIVRRLKLQLQQARNAERFVQLIVTSGIALVAGLWTIELASQFSGPWLVGALVVVAAVGGLVSGIRSQLQPSPSQSG